MYRVFNDDLTSNKITMYSTRCNWPQRFPSCWRTCERSVRHIKELWDKEIDWHVMSLLESFETQNQTIGYGIRVCLWILVNFERCNLDGSHFYNKKKKKRERERLCVTGPVNSQQREAERKRRRRRRRRGKERETEIEVFRKTEKQREAERRRSRRTRRKGKERERERETEREVFRKTEKQREAERRT